MDCRIEFQVDFGSYDGEDFETNTKVTLKYRRHKDDLICVPIERVREHIKWKNSALLTEKENDYFSTLVGKNSAKIMQSYLKHMNGESLIFDNVDLGCEIDPPPPFIDVNCFCIHPDKEYDLNKITDLLKCNKLTSIEIRDFGTLMVDDIKAFKQYFSMQDSGFFHFFGYFKDETYILDKSYIERNYEKFKDFTVEQRTNKFVLICFHMEKEFRVKYFFFD